jgi:hypothetical protein
MRSSRPATTFERQRGPGPLLPLCKRSSERLAPAFHAIRHSQGASTSGAVRFSFRLMGGVPLPEAVAAAISGAGVYSPSVRVLAFQAKREPGAMWGPGNPDRSVELVAGVPNRSPPRRRPPGASSSGWDIDSVHERVTATVDRLFVAGWGGIAGMFAARARSRGVSGQPTGRLSARLLERLPAHAGGRHQRPVAQPGR